MEDYFDTAWEYIYALIQKGTAALDYLLSYLHFLGPAPVIFLLAAVTVAITIVLKKYIKTQRLAVLEKDFHYWLEVREEAMRCEDREKGKALAKNIDSAKLNKAYYDFFLEGLLLGFITFYLPIISMAAYINEAYRSKRLLELFGRDYILKFGNNEPVLFGSLFFFTLSIIFIISSKFIVKLFLRKHLSAEKNPPSDCEKNQHQRTTPPQLNQTPEGLKMCPSQSSI